MSEFKEVDAKPPESVFQILWENVVIHPGWPVVVFVAALLCLGQGGSLLLYMHSANIPIHWEIGLIYPAIYLVLVQALILGTLDYLLRVMHGNWARDAKNGQMYKQTLDGVCAWMARLPEPKRLIMTSTTAPPEIAPVPENYLAQLHAQLPNPLKEVPPTLPS